MTFSFRSSLFFFFLLLSGIAVAQVRPEFRVQADYARFRGDANNTYVEVYYSFDVSLLSYVPKGTERQAEVVSTAAFVRVANDSVVARQAIRQPFSLSDTSMLSTSRSYSDIFGFSLPPDVYKLSVVVRDLNNDMVKDSISMTVEVKMLDTAAIEMSDVELATSIIPIDRDSLNRFYKNTVEVRPNPSRMYGAHQVALFYYIEAYNLRKNVSDFYYTRAYITNAVGREVYSKERAKRRANSSNVEMGQVAVHTLKSGVYTFGYLITDSVDNRQYLTSKKFFVYNPGLPTDTLVAASAKNIDATEYATMSEQELDKEFEQSRYTFTKSEIDQYKKYNTIEAKRKALYEYWTARDEDRTTPENETKKEYFRRVTVANTQYKTGFREGWKTDRGRVYILYGQPDDVERHANELDMKPYEIWSYNSIQGGVIFVFGDRTGFSDYILLHSTHRSELHDENWQRQIQAN